MPLGAQQQPQQPTIAPSAQQSPELSQLLQSPFVADTLMRVLQIAPNVRSGQLQPHRSGEYDQLLNKVTVSNDPVFANDLPQVMSHELGHAADFRGTDTEVKQFFNNMYRLHKTLNDMGSQAWNVRLPQHEFAAYALERAVDWVRLPKDKRPPLEQVEAEMPGAAMAAAFVQRRLNSPKPQDK